MLLPAPDFPLLLGMPSFPNDFLVLGHHDADGVVSAAIVGAFLRSLSPEMRVDFGTVDFHLQDRWATMWDHFGEQGFTWGRRFRPQGLALVDFPATEVPDHVFLFYADHHESAFRSCGATEALRRTYDARDSSAALIFFDPSVASCTRLLVDSLQRSYQWAPPASLQEAIHLAHRIDQADYGTVRDAIDYEGSRMARLDALVPALSEREAAESMRLLSTGASLDEALFSLHQAKTERLILDSRVALHVAQAIITPVGPFAALIDWSHPAVRGSRPVRFAEYYHSTARYGVRLEIEPLGEQWMARLTLSRSPWINPLPAGLVDPHFGRIAESLGGGGHSFAAGFRVTGEDMISVRQQAWRIIHDISDLLQPLEEGHPMSDVEG